MARRDPIGIRLLTQNGHDWSPRYPLIVEAVNRLKARSCLVDGEAVACDDKGVAVFQRLRRNPSGKRRTASRRWANSAPMFCHFNSSRAIVLLHLGRMKRHLFRINGPILFGLSQPAPRGFLNFTQSLDRPETQREPNRFETMPSSSIGQACWKTRSPGWVRCSLRRKPGRLPRSKLARVALHVSMPPQRDQSQNPLTVCLASRLDSVADWGRRLSSLGWR